MKTALGVAAAVALLGAAVPCFADDAVVIKPHAVKHKAVVHKKVVRPVVSHGTAYHPAKIERKVHRVEDAPDFRA
jgi:hypothetical protein